MACKKTFPHARLHKASGQAYIWVGGDVRYLGKHGTEKAEAEYRRLRAEWQATGGVLGAKPKGPLSVNEVLLAFVKHADEYYRKDGRPTSEGELVRHALRLVKELYGYRPAESFGSLALITVREAMIETGLARTTINKHVDRIKRTFKWAVARQLVRPDVYGSLRSVEGLRAGRSRAKEPARVAVVPEADVDAVQAVVSEAVAAMIAVQRLTGLRPGEVVSMRVGDLATRGEVWQYRPRSHKTEHYGKERVVAIGPEAQQVLRTFLRVDPDAYLFSPVEAEARRLAARRATRKSPVQPSQRNRSKRSPRWKPGMAYTVASYRRAVHRACARAGVDRWSPHRLRHNAATSIASKYGWEAARVVLGHSSVQTTAIYVERDYVLAERVMHEVG